MSQTDKKKNPVAAPTLKPLPTKPTYDTSLWDDSTKGEGAWKGYLAAQEALNTHGNKFTYDNEEQLKTLISDIMNGKKFSYDLNGDALYQQYKDKFIQQGKMARGDAIGQASAMTGGYGNSYAQSVGQQMYQKELQNLNDVVPELYQMALDKHNMERQDLYNQYGMLSEDYNRKYGAWNDTYGKLMDALGIARSDYYEGADMFYTEQGNKNNVAGQTFSDAMSIWEANSNNAWKKAEWEESARRYEIEDDWKEKQWDYQVGQDAADRTESNAKNYYETEGKLGYDNGSLSEAQIIEMQKALGIGQDGKWGSGSTSAAGGLTADQAWKAYQNGTLGKGKKPETVQPKETYRTTAFISRYQTKSEFLARGHNVKEWNEYMENNIAGFLHDDRIDEGEAQYLIEYYGLE